MEPYYLIALSLFGWVIAAINLAFRAARPGRAAKETQSLDWRLGARWNRWLLAATTIILAAGLSQVWLLGRGQVPRYSAHLLRMALALPFVVLAGWVSFRATPHQVRALLPWGAPAAASGSLRVCIVLALMLIGWLFVDGMIVL